MAEFETTSNENNKVNNSTEEQRKFLDSMLSFLEANLSNVDLDKCKSEIESLVTNSRWEHDMLTLIKKDQDLLYELERMVKQRLPKITSSIDIPKMVSIRHQEFEEMVHVLIDDSKSENGDRKRKREEKRTSSAKSSTSVSSPSPRAMPVPKKPRVEPRAE